MSTFTSTSVSLQQAYRIVADDLAGVRKIIDAELRSERSEMSELVEQVARFRGKMLRPALLLMTARATGGVEPIHRGLAAVVELFHLATLVHDDVLDEADTRRGAATINQRWNNESAVMLGDWLISHAYHLATEQGSRWASLAVSATSHRVCEGELMQLRRRGDLDLSIEDYLTIIELKTAALTGLSARLGAHFNNADETVEQACLDYGVALGVAFQITDDILDLLGDERQVGKTLGSDLAKGKMTLPLIHCLGNGADASNQLRKLLSADQPDTGAITALLNEQGCIASAEAVAREYVEQARSALAALEEGPARTALSHVADFVLVRNR
jgi:octaprenyl-diphosphate synthase